MKTLLSSLLILAVGLISGCAWVQQSEASQKEKFLSAAGFEVRPANTAQKQASLAAMTPYKVQMHTQGNNVYYTYANPKSQLLYVGGPQQYQAYQKLCVAQGIADQQQMAAAQMQMSAMEWNYWGGAPMFGGVATPMRFGR